MSWLQRALLTLGFAMFLWRSRYIPLSGLRRWAVMGCRLGVFLALGAALWGPPRRMTKEVPRQVVYLVDGSMSIDAMQRHWMAQRIASLEALRPARVERAMITFGSDAQVLVAMDRERLSDPTVIEQGLANARIDRRRTSLEAGLLSTLALIPPDHRGAVILLSDGRETSGNVTGLLAYARRLGLEVFTVPTPVFGNVKTVWEELAVSPVVQLGSPVAIQLVVRNGASQTRRAQVTIGLEGVPVKRQRVLVRPGWQVLTLSMPSLRRGTMSFDVDLTIPEEGLSEHRKAYAEVEGPPQVLLVTDRSGTLPALAGALKRRGMQMAVVRPADVPALPAAPDRAVSAPEPEAPAGAQATPMPAERAIQELLDYDAIALFNIPKSALSAPQVDLLRTYVEKLGGGLVMVGLGGDLAHEVNTPAPLDALLPVRFEPKGLQEAKRRVCMILLIDRSASMLGPRIAATKRAAVALIKQLASEDLVGVLAFDTKAYVVVEVQQAGQVGPGLVEKLVQLRSSGGTDVYPALVAAENRLELTGATLKHVILLSDGNTPFHEEAYNALTESLKLEGTTVSTIGIGTAFVNTDFLQWLAQSTGGTFYQMRTLNELPQLVARDSERELGRLPFAEGYFSPSKTASTDWFGGVVDWPPLRGYVTASPKDGARLDLTVRGGESEDPLAARWSLGAGRVVSFTSDADTRWSPDWIRWREFEGTWGQIMRWAMRPRLTEELFVWVDESRSTSELILEGRLHNPTATLMTTQGADARPLALIQTGAWRWHASLEGVPSGWYQLSLQSHLAGATLETPGGESAASPKNAISTEHASESSAPVFAKRWIQIGTPPIAEEIMGQPPRETFLRSIARSTAGLYDVPDRALVPSTTSVTMTAPLLSWWLPLAMLLLLLEIALRGSSML